MRRCAEPAALGRYRGGRGPGPLRHGAASRALTRARSRGCRAAPGWLDRITGASLQRIIARCGSQVCAVPRLAFRLGRLTADLAAEGLEVDESTWTACRGKTAFRPVHRRRACRPRCTPSVAMTLRRRPIWPGSGALSRIVHLGACSPAARADCSPAPPRCSLPRPSLHHGFAVLLIPSMRSSRPPSLRITLARCHPAPWALLRPATGSRR